MSDDTGVEESFLGKALAVGSSAVLATAVGLLLVAIYLLVTADDGGQVVLAFMLLFSCGPLCAISVSLLKWSIAVHLDDPDWYDRVEQEIRYE